MINKDRAEAVNHFLDYLNMLKKKSVVSKIHFDSSNNYKKTMNINPLSPREEIVMHILWKSKLCIFSKEQIKKLISDEDKNILNYTPILKSLVYKNYLLKTFYIDNTKPFFKRFTFMYTILLPYEVYCKKIDDVIELMGTNTNFLYVGINNDALDENQLERIRRICNGK